MSEINRISFKIAQEDYNTWGDQCVYKPLSEDTKLCDMSNDYIKHHIKKCEKTNLWIGSQMWIYIFQLELNNRRINKLKKIKSNLNNYVR